MAEEEGKKTTKCPRCGEASMEIDFKSGKARCTKCGYEIPFQK
jgi:ribosomal protein L37E